MEQDEWIDELDAQIEDHGKDKVLFLLEDETTKELYVKDVSFDGTYINVKLAFPV